MSIDFGNIEISRFLPTRFDEFRVRQTPRLAQATTSSHVIARVWFNAGIDEEIMAFQCILGEMDSDGTVLPLDDGHC
jgi:hypothetical protein